MPDKRKKINPYFCGCCLLHSRHNKLAEDRIRNLGINKEESMSRYTEGVKLYYIPSDLYEGLIIEDDNGVQNQVGYVFPSFRDKYGRLFSAAIEMSEALKIAKNEIERLAMVTGYEGEAHFPKLAQIETVLAKAEKNKEEV